MARILENAEQSCCPFHDDNGDARKPCMWPRAKSEPESPAQRHFDGDACRFGYPSYRA